MVDVFHSDERRIVEQMLGHMSDNSLDPAGYFNYGYFYHAVAFWVLKGYEAVGAHVDVRLVAFVFRLISLGCFGGALVALWSIQRVLGVGAGVRIAVTVVCGSLPSLVHFREFIHPDTLQLLCVLLAVRVPIGPPSQTPARAWLRDLHAALWAGLAFGTKYSGIFVLGFVWGLAGMRYLGELSQAKRRGGATAWAGASLLGVAAIFVFAWWASNPYVFEQWDLFVADFDYERGQLARGRGRAESTDGSQWLVFFRNDLPDGVLWGLALCLCASMYPMLGPLRPFGANAWGPRYRAWLADGRGPALAMCWIYCVVSMAHLYLAVNARRPQYLFHITPIALVICAAGAQSLLELLPKRALRRAVSVALVVGSGLMALQSLPASAKKTHRYSHPALSEGRWLAAHYPANTRILADKYTYLPAQLEHARITRGVLQRQIDRYKPDVIVINRAMSGRFNWKRDDSKKMTDRRFRTGRRDGAGKFRAFHQKLFAPDSPFAVVRERPQWVVLERKSHLAETGRRCQEDP